MKLDHFVINVSEKYQSDKEIIDGIRSSGLPYEPKWGKGTRGFKVSNLWIGNEYFEFVRILKSNGGGWIPEWTKAYIQGHRGMVCLMLDVEDIDEIYSLLKNKKISVTQPRWLEFKWFFNLLTRRMPWRNCYLPFFEGAQFQIGFQQMRDQEARDFMSQYMVPNAKENGIGGIMKAVIRAPFTNHDFQMLAAVFTDRIADDSVKDTSLKVNLTALQSVEFLKDTHNTLEIYTDVNHDKTIQIENITIHC